MTTVPTASTSVGAWMAPANPVELTDDEQGMVTTLAARLSSQVPDMLAADAYYNGLQTLYDLGVTIPPQLSRVRTVVDWPRICVDPLVQRAVVDGFRIPGATDVDADLLSIWQASNMDAEAPLCFLDALVFGRGYQIVGLGDDGVNPLITVESPLNMALAWDPRTRRPRAAYQAFDIDGVASAVLYLPNQNIYMASDRTTPGANQWVIVNRDEHNFGEVLVERFANRTRASDREGRSEITPAVRNTTDSACRSLLGMEIAREFYSIPHRYVLGANESDFVDASGNAKTALQMSMSKMLAFERDENGDVPTVGQFQAFDPSVFTKIIDKHAQLMASYTQFPPAYFGQTSTANPASADAIRVSYDGMDRRAGQVQRQFADPQERVMQLAWRVAHGGAALPRQYESLTTDWVDASIQTPAATTDAMVKQIAAKAVPPTSDVVLKRLGYDATERAQLEQDRQLAGPDPDEVLAQFGGTGGNAGGQ